MVTSDGGRQSRGEVWERAELPGEDRPARMCCTTYEYSQDFNIAVSGKSPVKTVQKLWPSLVVQWSKTLASNESCVGSIPSLGAKILHALCGQKLNRQKQYQHQ